MQYLRKSFNCFNLSSTKRFKSYNCLFFCSSYEIFNYKNIFRNWNRNKWAILIMFLHGLSRAALFMLAKIVYDFTNSRALVLTKGKINLFPVFSLFWALLITINMGVPPARRFWSEIFLLFGFSFKRTIFFVLFFLIAFFTTVYSCFLMIRIHHGKILLKINPFQRFNKSNFCPMFIFAFLSFALFIHPSIFFIY